MRRMVYRKRYPRSQDEHIAGRCGTPHGCAERKQGDLRSLVLGFSRIHKPVFPAPDHGRRGHPHRTQELIATVAIIGQSFPILPRARGRRWSARVRTPPLGQLRCGLSLTTVSDPHSLDLQAVVQMFVQGNRGSYTRAHGSLGRSTPSEFRRLVEGCHVPSDIVIL
jgi:hypothetical protein